MGHTPGRCKPGPQRRTRLIQHRAGSHRGLMAAMPAHQPPSGGAVRRLDRSTLRTDKSLRPTQLFEVARAGLLGGKCVHEVTPCARIILTRCRCTGKSVHGRYSALGGAKQIPILNIQYLDPVSYTHLTLPTIYSV